MSRLRWEEKGSLSEMLELNKIYNMDCLEGMKLIPDKSIDMILCDLPYGTIACKWDTIIPFEPLWEQYERIIKDNGAIVLFGSQPFTSKLIMSNLKMFKYEWIWDKVNPSGFQIAKYQPLKQHENILVFGKNKINYYPIKIPRDKTKKSRHYGKSSESNPLAYVDNINREYSDYNPKSIITVSNANRKGRLHPTQKPVALLEYLIKTYTQPGEIVLDNCIGSGTTAIAALNTGRFFIGIEKEPKYVEIARKRVEQAQAQQSLFGTM